MKPVKLDALPQQLLDLTNSPKQLFFVGDLSLLNRPMVAVVGTRRPSQYTKATTFSFTKAISDASGAVVSGAAMGCDACAHEGALPNTIAVMANSLDIIYPQVNKPLIEKIYTNSLALSEYEPTTKATEYSFVLRNRIVVALSRALVIAQADLKSGSMRSAEVALKLGRPIYVLPQRLGESEGTNYLLKNGLAKPIYEFEQFLNEVGLCKQIGSQNDEMLEFCKSSASYDEAYAKFGERVLEYELAGKIAIENGRVKVL